MAPRQRRRTNMLYILGAIFALSAAGRVYTQQEQTNSTTTVFSNDEIYIEFDESDIRNLNLKLKWGFTNATNKTTTANTSASIPTRFVLLMETKRINFSTFLFDYSSPQLVDDEQVVKASMMKAENFKKRVVLFQQSPLDCSMNCINSTRYSTNEKTFDCNIFYYDSTTRTCVLYEYDFVNEYKKKRYFQVDEIYDYFNDECDMDEILGDVVGYSRLCKRILDYRDEHIIKINPYIDYRFSLSLRNQRYEWTALLRREYQYAPKISIDVRGEIRLGGNVTLECKTELSEAIVDSITWKNNNPAARGSLVLSPLTIGNLQQTYYCEIRFNFFRMIQKAFRLNATALGDLKPVLKINYTTDVESLNVTLNWTVKAPLGSHFKPEKMILLYSENNSTYKFVNKYLLFELSKFDNARLASARDSEDITTTNEDECAMSCLQKSFCDHFVFIRSVEPFRNNKRKNCRLVTNNYDNLFPCRYDLVCANLSPFEKHVQNDMINILILPNITYRFKIQLKDKHLNWTDVEETEPIYIPMKIKLEQRGETEINSTEMNNGGGSSKKFELSCQSNINRENIQHQISWLRDDKEIQLNGGGMGDDFRYFSVYSSNDTQYANSVLVFRQYLNESANYTGVYKCSIYIRYPEVGQGTAYLSEGKFVQFSFNRPLKYETTAGNLSLPTVPGLLLELNCQISGRPINSAKWLIDGVNYNEKASFNKITDDPFVINITDPIDSSVHNILVMKIDTPKKLAKYECILNDDIVVRTHYIEIIDQKPELEYKIDKSNLNRLQLSIDLKLKNTPYVPKYAALLPQPISIETKPLKVFILYSENSTLESAVQTTIAPNTLSRTDINWRPSAQTDKIKLGSLKPTQHDIESCKLVCFNTPFCRAYEYVSYDDSCNFYSDSKVDVYYKNLIDTLKSVSTGGAGGNFSFNLIHLLQADFFNLVEEKAFANVTVLDTKQYASCGEANSTTSNVDDSETTASCSDQLADFATPYLLADLTPQTTYQFRIELATAFGKSSVYLTETVSVPFELNPIRVSTASSLTSLMCSTPLIESTRLKFAWFRNEQPLSEQTNDASTYQILPPKLLPNNSLLYSELILKSSDPKTTSGYYTCSLTFARAATRLHLSRNQSILFRPSVKPTYPSYTDQTLVKQAGDMWTDSCAASGWPLPSLRWTLNGRAVANHSSEASSSSSSSAAAAPYTITHHRNLTVTAFVIAQNLSSYVSAGRYTCWLDADTPIKNVSLVVRGGSPPPPNPPPQPPPSTDDNGNNIDEKSAASSNTNADAQQRGGNNNGGSKFLLAILATLLVCVLIAGVLAFFYYKRKPSSLNASFAYNPLQEQVTSGTGVDNINLTDDNNQ